VGAPHFFREKTLRKKKLSEKSESSRVVITGNVLEERSGDARNGSAVLGDDDAQRSIFIYFNSRLFHKKINKVKFFTPLKIINAYLAIRFG